MDIKQLSMPLYQAKGWMKLIGALLIIYGILTALSVVGIIFAWIPVWMGVLLFQAANRANDAYANGDETVLLDSLGKIKLFFIINGVWLLIILILVFVGGLIMGGGLGMLGLLALMSEY